MSQRANPHGYGISPVTLSHSGAGTEWAGWPDEYEAKGQGDWSCCKEDDYCDGAMSGSGKKRGEHWDRRGRKELVGQQEEDPSWMEEVLESKGKKEWSGKTEALGNGGRCLNLRQGWWLLGQGTAGQEMGRGLAGWVCVHRPWAVKTLKWPSPRASPLLPVQSWAQKRSWGNRRQDNPFTWVPVWLRYRCRPSGLDLFAKLPRNNLKKKRHVQDRKAFLAMSLKAETTNSKWSDDKKI